MRVGIVSTSDISNDTRLQKEAVSLARAGYDVVVIGPAHSAAVAATLERRFESVRVIVVGTPRSRAYRFVIAPWRTVLQCWRVKVDVYHLANPELLIPALILLGIGKKIVFDMKEDTAAQIDRKPWVPRFLRQFTGATYRVLERLVTRRIVGVIAAGPEMFERLGGQCRRVVLVENFPQYSCEAFVDDGGPATRERDIILNLGGISGDRAIEPIVRAIGLLPEVVRRKVVIGGLVNSPELLNKLMDLPAWKDITFVGRYTYEQKEALLKRAAVALVLYSPEPNHYDIRSNRFFEALAHGVPVVTSNFPRWREMVEGIYGFTADPEDEQSIAETILRVLSNPELSADMGRRGRLAARQRFSWQVAEAQLLAMYGAILPVSKPSANPTLRPEGIGSPRR